MSRAAQAVGALRAVFRNENLRRVELAWGASIAAEWAHYVALGVFAYNEGGVAAVGIAGLVRMLPAALVAPFDIKRLLSDLYGDKAPDTLLERMKVAGHGVPGHYHLEDIPAPVWPPPVERGDYITQRQAPQSTGEATA
jgi:hypothetical protein